MKSLLLHVWNALSLYSGWMAWNLFLAFIPFALSLLLFRQSGRSRTILWWVAFVVFIAFLPNAPYLLTDIIHLIRATRDDFSIWVITLVFIPQHTLVILAGFEAYVLSLMNFGSYLRAQGSGKFVLWVELITHALCSVGIYLGRFLRFNSWDLVTAPDRVAYSIIDDLTAKRPIFVMAVTFVILTVLYWLFKQINLGLMLRIRTARTAKSIPARSR
ncbi:DUF1361 domain-containing protein [Lusitaniella coriacea LEGE 07157]|uniref:DUF1361 domain-containing protein n=1 Tax=Lusitaniella coriacea LEGE 07157 TaxID=945747 RepID=A0A8J7E055_9CYAN|nr:DUF1361 domain-containing protein [Lusitaniella coriacea]MBE9116894.1 DUF1361 domain-containing protein [Lusitaniella coriacea LEGE 07157]